MISLLRRRRRPNLDCITPVCICGSVQWVVWVTFDPDTWEIATFGLDMYCAECGAKAETPTPIDHPDYKEDQT